MTWARTWRASALLVGLTGLAATTWIAHGDETILPSHEGVTKAPGVAPIHPVVEPGVAPLEGTIPVVTTTETIAVLVREIGGSDVVVESFGDATTSPHVWDARRRTPSLLKKAKLLVMVGLGLEESWLSQQINIAGNREILFEEGFPTLGPPLEPAAPVAQKPVAAPPAAPPPRVASSWPQTMPSAKPAPLPSGLPVGITARTAENQSTAITTIAVSSSKNGVGALVLSEGMPVVDLPRKGTDRAKPLRDLHPAGNPHLWMDPRRMPEFALLIAKRLGQFKPAQLETFSQRAAAFSDRWNRKLAEWEQKLAPFAGVRVASYHDSFAPLLRWAGFDLVNTLEVSPGTPPTASHLYEFKSSLKGRELGFVLLEAFDPEESARELVSGMRAPMVRIYSGIASGPKKLTTHKNQIRGSAPRTLEEIFDTFVSSVLEVDRMLRSAS